jgi:hypothetical protein
MPIRLHYGFICEETLKLSVAYEWETIREHQSSYSKRILKKMDTELCCLDKWTMAIREV